MTVNQFYLNRAWEAQARQQLARISNKLYRVSAKYEREPALYFAEARFYAWLCGQSWAQQRYWPGKVDVVHTFLRETQRLGLNPSHTSARVTQQVLFASAFSQRWFQRLSAWPRMGDPGSAGKWLCACRFLPTGGDGYDYRRRHQR